MARHLHYIMQGYRAETDGGGLADVTTVDLLMDEADEKNLEVSAKNRAKRLVKKDLWRVRDIIEHDDVTCTVTH